VLPAGRHKLHVTFNPEDTGKYAVAESIEVIEVEAVPNLDSLHKASSQTSFATTEEPEQPTQVEAEEEVYALATPVAQQRAPETRVYKGAVYEKGDDGQWHLQRT
jgi:hypothetical protein